METTETTPDLLTTTEPYLIRADTGKRFLNYIVDVIIFYVIIFLVSIIIGLFAPDALVEYVENGNDSFNPGETLIFLSFYAIYMGIVEAIFKGKSLGKLITGTRAVNMDGSRISVGTAFGRGFSRAVPFAAFSALGSPCNPWQDKWTKTIVIDEKQSDIGTPAY